MNPTPVSAGDKRDQLGWSRVPTGFALLVVVVILYAAREVLIPLALALLLSFALAPIVSFLRRRSVPRVLAVALSVSAAFAVIGLAALLVIGQVSSLATNIPTYQSNIIEKVRALREMGAAGGVLERLSGAVERVGAEIEKGTQPAAEQEPSPLQVEVVNDEGPVEILHNIVVPLVSPFATSGLIIVVVIFMLLDRENLRDRFIRLVGYSDLHRTTEALEDAGTRVGRYLLMQLVVNTLYAIPVAVGLTLIGLPNAVLWGVLALFLRFVPYIGPAIAMVLPLFLAIAVAPGWSLVLWTAALFIVLELVSNNILEPWLYGSRTGLSPVAIIVAAIFWTWLWGPLGLLLSTPLTVCLVVLGKHVPQFAFFDVLLGNEPVLDMEERLYQRFLAGDADEATDHAEDCLRDDYLVDFYDKVGIPALLLAEQDRQRGALLDERLAQVADSAQTMVANLQEIAEAEEEEEEEDDDAPESVEGQAVDGADEQVEIPDGSGRNLLCIGGRGVLDDAAAAMLAQVLEVEGAEAAVASHPELELRNVRKLDLEGIDTVIVVFLNAASGAHARHAVRRLKRLNPSLRVGIFMPGGGADGDATPPDAAAISADFVAGSVVGAVVDGLTEAPPVHLRQGGARISRRRPVPRASAVA